MCYLEQINRPYLLVAPLSSNPDKWQIYLHCNMDFASYKLPRCASKIVEMYTMVSLQVGHGVYVSIRFCLLQRSSALVG